MGSSKQQQWTRLRTRGCVALCCGRARPGGAGGGREGGMGLLCPWRERHAAGPLPKPAETPGTCSARCGRGSAPPASNPRCRSAAPPRCPRWGSLKIPVGFFPPMQLWGPHSVTNKARDPCQGERLPSPLPPLTLFSWTEGCLGESFSTLFHIHNGLNIGEQSGTWRAKPCLWSEPLTSPPR